MFRSKVVCLEEILCPAFPIIHVHCIPITPNGPSSLVSMYQCIAIVSICVADDVIFPWYFSFMDLRCDLSAKIAKCFKSIVLCSLNPEGTVRDGGWGIVMSRSWSLVTGWLVCFVGGDKHIMMSAGCLGGSSGISPVGSMTDVSLCD
jgi:hypothetical protein